MPLGQRVFQRRSSVNRALLSGDVTDFAMLPVQRLLVGNSFNVRTSCDLEVANGNRCCWEVGGKFQLYNNNDFWALLGFRPVLWLLSLGSPLLLSLDGRGVNTKWPTPLPRPPPTPPPSSHFTSSPWRYSVWTMDTQHKTLTRADASGSGSE